MTTSQFAKRLQEKLEKTYEFWRAKTDDPHQIAQSVQVALYEVSDCVRHALKDPPRPAPTGKRKK